MRVLVPALVFALLAAVSMARAETLAITDVQVVDVASGRTRPAQTVLVEDGEIRAVGDSRRIRVPERARRIDGNGRFLVPGFWDMGSYVLDAKTKAVPGAFELMVAHGVIGTRDINTALPAASSLALERDIQTGRIVGPKLIWTTRPLTKSLTAGSGTTAAGSSDIVDDAAAAAAVMAAADGGAHYVRILQNLPEQRLPAVIRAAHVRRLAVTGAIVSSWKEAAEAGLDGFDHVVDLYRSTARRPERDQYLRGYRDAAFRAANFQSLEQAYAFFAKLRQLRDEPYYRATLAALSRARTPVTTNMATTFWAQERNAGRIQSRLKYAHAIAASPAPPSALEASARDGMWADLRDLKRANVPILAGTQAGASARALPGATLHDELELLVAAGFTPREALAAATINPAAVIARSYPRVRAARGVIVGEPADLVLLDANPLTAIENVRLVNAVVANGRFFGPQERAALLERAAALASPGP